MTRAALLSHRGLCILSLWSVTPFSRAVAQHTDSIPRVLAPTAKVPLPLDSLAAGMRLRLHAHGLVYNRTGTLQARLGDTLLFLGERHRDLVRVPLGRTDWLWVSTGRGMTTRRQLAGVGIGLVVGTAGAVLHQLLTRERGGTDCGDYCPEAARRRRTGAIIGATLGFGIAAARPGDRWRRVALPARAR